MKKVGEARYWEALDEWDGAGFGIFLGGGISNCQDWQQVMVRELSSLKIDLLNPRRENFPMHDPAAAEEQIKWEHHHLNRADAVLFWFSPETLCPITLFELGTFVRTDLPLFVGVDPNYARKRDVEIQLRLYRPDVVVVYSVVDLANEVKKWHAAHSQEWEHRRSVDSRREFIIRGQTIAPISSQGCAAAVPRSCCNAGSGTCGARPGRLRRFVDCVKRLLGAKVRDDGNVN